MFKMYKFSIGIKMLFSFFLNWYLEAYLVYNCLIKPLIDFVFVLDKKGENIIFIVLIDKKGEKDFLPLIVIYGFDCLPLC